MAAAPRLQRLAAGRDASARNGSGADRDRYGRLVAFAICRQMPSSPCSRPCWRKAGAGLGPRRRQGLRRSAASRRSQGPRRPARAVGRSKFCPFGRRKSCSHWQRERGHFTLVEGKVLSVRESGGTIYLNFGRRWTRDFSVIILRAQLRASLPPPASSRRQLARPAHPGARLYRTAQRPGHRGRRARADRARRVSGNREMTRR